MSASSSKPVTMTSDQALNAVPDDVRNDIYSALLSGTGIRNIEGTLEHELQASGFLSNLRGYATQLLRSGECTTFDDVKNRIIEKIKRDTDTKKSNGVTNGVNGMNGHKDSDDYDLSIPRQVYDVGIPRVQRELREVCEITNEGENK